MKQYVHRSIWLGIKNDYRILVELEEVNVVEKDGDSDEVDSHE